MRTRYTYHCESYLKIDGPRTVHLDDCEITLEGGGRENTICRLLVTVPGNHADNDVLAHEICSFLANYLTIMHGDARFLVLREAQRVEILEGSEGKGIARALGGSVGCFISGIGPLDEISLRPQNIDRFQVLREPLSAYVDGLDARSELDKFTNFYRVIEWKFDPGNRKGRQSAKERLRQSGLPKLIEKLATEYRRERKPPFFEGAPSQAYIERLVDLRDRCSHLRRTGFGYSTQDLVQLRDVRNCLPLVQGLARSILMDETGQLPV